MNASATPPRLLATRLCTLPWDAAPESAPPQGLSSATWPAPAGADPAQALLGLRALLLRYGAGRPNPLLLHDAARGGWCLCDSPVPARFDAVRASLDTAPALGPDPTRWADLGGLAVVAAPAALRTEALALGERLRAPWVWLQAADGGGEMHFDGGRFTAATLQRSQAHWAALVKAAQQAPDGALDAPALMDTAERQSVIDAGRPAADAPTLAPLSALLAAQVQRQPAACAYRDRGESLDFAGLSRWSAVLAQQLREQGLRPGEPVAVVVERSLRCVAAMMAIWRAGGCYLPVDVDHPESYVGHILQQCEARLAIADETWAPRLRGRGLQVVACGELPGENAPVFVDAAPADPAQAAAIFYTSGSTGQPKGVVHSHASVLNRLGALYRHLPTRDDDCLGQRTNISFIPSMGELMGAIVTGCRTVIIASAVARDPDALAALIRAEGITRVGMVPSLLKTFLSGPPARQQALAQLRLVSVAGEVLCADTARSLRQCCPTLQVVNDYGCTETNGVLLGALDEWHPERPVVPAGRPIARVQALVMDAAMRPLPFNLEGDLYLAGLAVGAGYLGRPEETARRYLALDSVEGLTRVYATGDRARLLADGQIEVLGRGDNVVKVRGNRVELEGVEAVLQRHPGVRQVAVAADAAQRKLQAWLVEEPGAALTTASLREHLQAHLPPYMVPCRFVVVDALPRTLSGKLDRARLRQSPPDGRTLPQRSAQPPAAAVAAPSHDSAWWLDQITRQMQQVTGDAECPDPDTDFQAGGLDSLGVVQLAEALSRTLGVEVSAMQLFDQVTPRQLALYLAAQGAPATALSLPEPGAAPEPGRVTDDGDIAIIGMAGRFPGAPDLETFWTLVESGAQAITEVPADRWPWADSYRAGEPAAGRSVSRWGGFLDDIASFDPQFFGLSAREARSMDPQQRLMLQTAWHAFEDAGLNERLLGQASVGIYIGARPGDYTQRLQDAGLAADGLSLVGNDTAVIAGRIAYHLNLHGPALSVDTACSSSLVALHLACQALRAGECELAVAGGVSLMTGPEQHIASSQAGMLSPSGHCATFSDQADGFVQGEGVAAIVLKPLARALADGDRVWAIVKASAINQDGRSNGITAPNGLAQRALLRTVYGRPGLGAQTVQAIETHGTGTRLGDPIEVLALAEGLGEPDPGQRWVLGSVKPAIGHLIAAAGMAGLVKMTLALNARRLPPSPRPAVTNPHIPFDHLPFDLLDTARAWEVQPAQPRRAGVSSFGFSGTNAHVLLQEPPESVPQAVGGQAQLVLLTARTEASLRAQASQWREWLERHPQAALEDIAYTAQRRTHGLPVRAAIAAADRAELGAALTALGQGAVHPALQVSVALHLPAEVGRVLLNGGLELLHSPPQREVALRMLATAFAAGALPDGPLAVATHARLLSLPGQAFERERCWPTPAGRPGPLADPVRPAEPRPRQFEQALRGDERCVTEHEVGGRMIVPGAAQVTLLLRGLAAPGTGQAVALHQVAWPAPVECTPGHARTLRIDLGKAGDDALGASFVVRARADDLLSPVVCQGRWRIESGAAEQLPRLAYGGVLGRCVQRIEPEDYYARLRALGVAYGPSFRRIRSYRSGLDEALAVVDLTPLADCDLSADGLQPAQLDAILHCTAGLLGQAAATRLFVPFSLGRWRWNGELPAQALVHVHRHRGHGTQVATFDLLVADAEGQVCMQLEDLVLKALPDAERSGNTRPPVPAPAPAEVHPDGGPLATLVWQPTRVAAALPARSPAQRAAAALLVHGTAAALAPLERHWPAGARTIWSVAPGTGRPSSREDWHQLLVRHRPQVLVQVLDAALTDARQVHDSLLLLAQSCAAQTGHALPAVLVATEANSPAGLAASGLLRAWAAEAPSLRWRVLSLPEDPLARAAAIEAEAVDLAATPSAGPRAAEVDRSSAERREYGWAPWTAGPADAPALPREAVCVISGGLGGAGLRLARHLVQHRAARVALLGRRPAGEKSAAVLAELRALGGEACYLQADVADRQAVQTALAQVRRRFLRIDAVFHCAGVIRDALLARKTPAQAGEVLASKVDGARWLDELTAADPLHCLVLFSSISAAIGSAGQADYAYANRYLDAYAERRARQVAAGQRSGRSLSVNWPLLADGQMQPSAEMRQRLRQRMGMAAMPGEAMCELLLQLIDSGPSRALVLHGEPERLRQTVPPLDADRRPTVHPPETELEGCLP